MAVSAEQSCAQRDESQGVLSREGRVVAVIVVVSLAVRVLYAASSDIFQDEALYWWQAHEALGFSPHPPALLLMIRWSSAVFGHGVLSLRLGSLVWGTAGIVLSYLLGRDMYGRRAGLWAAALFASCLLFVAAGVVAGPDALLLFLWLLLMYTAWRAAHGKGSGWWIASGVVLAAGLYTKYMMVLALPCVLLALCAAKEGRVLLRRRGPWLAAALGLGLFVPVFLLWDWQHNWVTLGYHLVGRHSWRFSWSGFGDYVLLHAGALSPVLYIGVVVALVWAWRAWRRRADWRGAWVLSFSLVPILFFFVPSVFTKRQMVREHWDAIGYATAMVGLAGLLTQAGGSRRWQVWRRRLGVGSLAVALLFTGAILLFGLLPGLAVKLASRVPMRSMIGWRELAARVREVEANWEGPPPFIATDCFRSAVCLGFHLNRRDNIYSLRHGRNKRYGLENQLNEWGIDYLHMLEERAGQDALYVHEYRISSHTGKKYPPTHVYRCFRTVEPIGELQVFRGGRQVKLFGFFYCQVCEGQR